jgi:Sulfatase
VRPWDSLNADEKRLFARMAEVYAGFSEYTDAQVGQIVDYLEQTNQLDNTTIIFYCADNGASGEGSPNGSVNENKFFNGYPDELSENMQYLESLGSPHTYNHYPTGWAVAFSTLFQMFKRYAQFAGGTCDPLVVHWPRRHQGQGAGAPSVPPRHRHRADRPRRGGPENAGGLSRGQAVSDEWRVDAVQLRRRRRAYHQEAPVLRDAGNPRNLGGRLEGGGAARTLSGKGHFDQDKWELYHVDEVAPSRRMSPIRIRTSSRH